MLNRHERRAAAAARRKRTFADRLTACVDEHGVYSAYIVGVGDLDAAVRAARGGHSVAAACCQVIREWFAQADDSTGDDLPPLCIDCDTEFKRIVEPPAGFALMFPFSKNDRAIASGICRRCWNSDKGLLDMAIRSWRKIMPGLRRIEGGRA
jgi:hypothetical protein